MASMLKLPMNDATPTSFADFGQVIEASPDGERFRPRDAQLSLSRGIPSFYVLHPENRPLTRITHHARVTQCLIAKTSIVNPNEDIGKKVLQSKFGHSYVPPHPDDFRVFRISGPKFVKLHIGTWHAGPLFKGDTMDFYNLELVNTNDHTAHDFEKEDGVIFSFDD
ncbi:hypothetical protein MKX01_000415 [Papaver californicum]|nr:hypothetical protein MKX01_000415 [Papaver californicum]